MKLLTLNTHSLSEENGDHKRKVTAKFIADHDVDFISLQEVNQTKSIDHIHSNFYIKEDNYASALVKDLKALGLDYEWVWLPIKIGYGKYDEGLALLSKHPILKSEELLLSHTNDIEYWKKRNALGIYVKYNEELIRIYNVHMGWWNDEEEPFIDQWNILNNHIHMKNTKVYIAGDFNGSDDVRNESYDQVKKDGWFDTFELAEYVYGHNSMKGQIDGWEDSQGSGKRIDYIFTNIKKKYKKHEIVFDGKNNEIVSDHFGILLEE